jgi:hypothetical protein
MVLTFIFCLFQMHSFSITTPMVIAINKHDVLQSRNDSKSREEFLFQTWHNRFPRAGMCRELHFTLECLF